MHNPGVAATPGLCIVFCVRLFRIGLVLAANSFDKHIYLKYHPVRIIKKSEEWLVQIDKKGFVFKVAYGLNCYSPDSKSLCLLFWKFVFMVFLGWPAFILYVIVAALFLFLFAHRLGFFKGEHFDESYRFKNWPEIHGHRIWPVIFVLPVLAYYFPNYVFAPVAIAAFVGFAVSISLGVLFGWFFSVNNEVGTLFVSYIKAKKEKVCPIVEFVDMDRPSGYREPLI